MTSSHDSRPTHADITLEAAASPVEADFFAASRVHPAPGLNTIANAVRIRGALAPDRLEAALRDVCTRHEVLRRRLDAIDGVVVRIVTDEAPVPLLELRPCPATDAALAEELDDVRRSLSPDSLPWKAVLLRHGADDHTLVFAAHRTIWDERSTRLLGPELSGFYAGGSEGARAQNSCFTPSRPGEGARAFASTLRDLPAIHGFPTRGPRPRSQDVAAAGFALPLDEATRALVTQTARAWGLEPFVVLAAATLHVLSYHCGQDRIAVGLPFDLSRGPAEQGSLGSLTAILPLGFDASAPTFEALTLSFAERIRSVAADGATPFEAMVKELGTRGDPSANPLFQIACVEDADLALTFEGCVASPRPVFPPPQQLDIFLRVTPGELRGSYTSRLIAEEAIDSFARSLSVFLPAALREPRRKLFELPVLTSADREELLGDGDGTAQPSYLDGDLYRLVTRHCAPGSTRLALTCGGKGLCYGEMLGVVDALAGALAASGLAAGALVGVCMPRSVDMVVAMLAVLRGGNAYVPLDPAFPEQRLEYVVEHSRLSHVITTRALRPMFDRAHVHVVEIGQDTGYQAPPPPAVVLGESRAYVIYTSGSTGRPKGVAVSRRALSSFLQSMLRRPGVGADDTLCAVTTLSFDIAELELLAPLCAGGTVVIATEEETHDPRLLIGLLAAHHATLLQATPVTWQMLCAAGWSGSPSLTALCGGEALLPALARDLVPRVRALWNMYGPTETTVWSTCQRIENPDVPISVGTPIANTAVYVLDDHQRLVPAGVEGRLFIGGDGVALGYLHDDDLTVRRFVPDPFRGEGRMYNTGDRARRDRSGALFVVGRSDLQVKLRGYRIELGEVEACLSTLGALDQVACTVRRDDPAAPELAAYFTLRAGSTEPTVAELRAHCGVILPPHMVPSRFRRLDAIPRTPNGKVDRSALPRPAAEKAAGPSAPSRPRSDVERTLTEIWCSVLGILSAGVHDNFFELGGTSLAAFSVAAQIGRRFGVEISVLRIFEHATIADLAGHLQGDQAYASAIREAYEYAGARRRTATSPTAFDVAIVGAAGRFPGARNLDELWKNLRDGRETVTTFSRDELDPLVPREDREDPSYVPRRGVLEDIDRFDAAFFGISPNEAELMSPQIRVFMEVAWEAFENAGYVGETIPGPVGVWAGMGNNFYYVHNVLTRPDKLAVMGEITAEIANEKDHIAPRISHKLNLRGPSLSVHAACATTLIVIENAYEALVSHQVDVALAGGVDIRTPQKSGQRYEEGGVFSIDGHCRPFDASATGTMFGEGVGAVVLKRLDDAVRDGDTIHAVIKGAAVNHDGGHKVSYLAPSIEGQARVIAAALGIADVNPETITYVEGHGTATPIGDPIEVEALTRVYRTFTQRRRYCAIGSIKGNFGHATTASGVAGVLKVVLALRHGKIPPTLHFTAPNPRIDFASSPFFVADKLLDWAPAGTARRASVSSFGFCGTNAHVILEEAPPAPMSSRPLRPAHLVLMSARSRPALDATAERLSSALQGAGPTDMADMAYTTHVGRKRHEHRRCAVVLGSEEVAVTLAQAAGPRSASLESDAGHPPVAFMFPGQGSQYVDMGLRLYQGEPLFRQIVDRCAATLSPELGCDLRGILFPDVVDAKRARESLGNTRYTQPAIFVLSYGIASLYRHWGIEPSAFLGHSIGEFVAATLCGVMELDDALRLVATRGRLMQGLPSGSMLSVRLPMQTLVERLPAGVDLAAENGPQLCVVAGPSLLVAALRDELSAEGVACRMLHTSHAFHSSMMDPVVEPFLRVVEGVRLSPPHLPFVSTVTGDWIEASQATEPAYWARHLRSPVQFSRAVRVLLQDSARVVLECGPRRTCAALALQQGPARPGRIIAAMPDSADRDDEYPSVLLALGCLWLNGCTVDWSAFHERETRRRRALPTYPFQRRRFWIEPGSTVSFGVAGAGAQPSVTPQEHGGTSGVTDAAARDTGSVRDRTTASVVTLLEELLGHGLGGFDEDARFIALGLDSLLLTQLAQGVRKRLGFEVTFRQLSERLSSTKLLADAIRSSPAAARSTTNGTPAVRTGPAAAPTADPARVALSTTPTQLEMWLSSQASPEAACACNASFTVNLSGAVDDGALVRALRALPERHAALRGRYGAGGEQFFIETRLDVEVPRYDLSKLSPAGRAEALRQLAEQDARTPYHTEKGPLFRAALVELGPGERAVLLGAHQGACDGWSLDVLLADLGRLYSAFAGKTPMPAPAHHDVRDYLTLRASPAYADRLASSRDFWRKSLEALPPSLALPHDGRLSRVRSPRVEHALRVVPQPVIDLIKAFARAQGVSFFSVLLSGYAVLLHRLSGATDSLVGVPVAGHPDAGMEDCVGCLVSVVPLRLRVDPQQSFLDLCRATNASVLDAREHAVMGFGEIASAVALPPDPVRLPPLAITFTHVQKHGPGKLPFEGCSVGYYMNPRASQFVELDLNVVESEDALELKIHGNTELYSRQWLDSRLREFERLLGSGCHSPQTPVSALTMPRGDEVQPRPLAAVAWTSDPGPTHGACNPAAPASAWRPYITILRGASRSLATAYKLRDCAEVGAGSRVVGRVWIHGEGRIVIGQRVLLDGSGAPIELHVELGAQIVIGDDVVVGGGTSIEATHSVSIGARTRVNAGCKIMDSHFHALDDRLERPPARAVVVEEDVQLGRKVILMAGARVGRGTIVEARTVVGRPIGPDAVARGIPAKIHRHGGTNAHRR